jgi:hypothetical protein
VTTDQQLGEVEPLTPIRPVSRRRLTVRAVAAPFVWLTALVVAAIVVHRTDAIGIGLAVAFGSLVVATVGLSLIRAARNRERRRYAERG